MYYAGYKYMAILTAIMTHFECITITTIIRYILGSISKLGLIDYLIVLDKRLP